ncbi:MAG: AAA family ATPase [Candidatus Dependentiae bacterium]|nr:AAA family ATPase [Candidatus Dependentiae bacterium]
MIRRIYPMLTLDTISKNYISKAFTLFCFLSSSFINTSDFRYTKASDAETFATNEAYKQFFKKQEEIYQDLLTLGIPGARPLSINQTLAEEVLTNCPREINDTISSINQRVFFDNEKDMILHGMSGTGKSCLAQAIAIKTKSPCLFFNAGSISTEYMNSGVQNLNRIFEYAQRLEKSLGKPCIIIFDELEALTKKHAGKNNHESNILISFWQELDKLNNSKIIVIGTMNRTDDLPVQITNRTSIVEVSLPTDKHREATLDYFLTTKKDKYMLEYPEWITAAYLAKKTKGFSNRDLQNLVARATKQAILAPSVPDKSSKFVPGDYFTRIIKETKKDPKRKLEREIGTWKHTFKTNFRDPRITLPLAAVATTLIIAYNTISNHKELLIRK